LCSTCGNDPLCVFPRRRGTAVIECLEFEGETRKQETLPMRGSPGSSARETAPRVQEPGLCSWCDNRPTCDYPRSAGGVWFCEEYQ
jgi:hypothetical protein